MNIKFASIQAEKNVIAKFHRASSRTSICPTPSMDLKKDGLPQAVRPVLPPGLADWMVRNTGIGGSVCANGGMLKACKIP